MLLSGVDTHFIKEGVWRFSSTYKLRLHYLFSDQPRRTVPPDLNCFNVSAFIPLDGKLAGFSIPEQ